MPFLKFYRVMIVFIALTFLISSAYAQPFGMGALREETIPSWIKPSPPIELLDDYDQACDLSSNFPPIGNQGGQGSCTAWATAYYYKSYQEWQEHGWDLNDPNHRFSPAFVYNQINGGIDWGSYPSDAFKLLTELGCTSIAQMPYTDQNCTNQPSEEDYYTAIPFRSQDVYYIDLYYDLTDIKNHLLNGNAAVFAFSVYDNFNNIGNYNNIYCLSQIIGTNPGGHAVTFCGFDDSLETADGWGAFKVANSWGATWGDNGYFWMSYQAIQSPVTCWGTAYYTTDRIGYEPTVLAVFRSDHADRYALEYQFGIGNYNDPLWSQDFFDWYSSANVAWPFEASNIVIDLTDGASFLYPGYQNTIYMRAEDDRPGNSLTGSITDFTVVELVWPASSSSPYTPIAIPDNGSYAYATLEISQGSGTPVSGEATGTWTPENNPYYVSGDISVPAGETLVIEAGTQVLFLEYGGFIVSEGATLQAVGTETEPVLFSPLIYAVGWHGIRFENASNDSRLEHCHLRYGKAMGAGNDGYGAGIFCNLSDPSILNCLIEEGKAKKGGAIYCLNSNPEINSNTLTHNEADEAGGAIYCQQANPTISGNIITENFSLTGGGIYCSESSPLIEDNTIHENEAGTNGGGIAFSNSEPLIRTNNFENNSSTHGGAVYSQNSDPAIEENSFTANHSSQGGAVYTDNGNITISDNTFDANDAPSGGAIYCFQSSGSINANIITENLAGNGGAIYCWFGDVDITSNQITGNEANGFGGGVYSIQSTFDFLNNLINANTATCGGGMYLLSAFPAVINSTIVDNTATNTGGGIGGGNGTQFVLMNSIVYGNTSGQITMDSTSTCEADYCDIQGGWEGANNIDLEPMFAGISDYQLSNYSPCIGAANAECEIGGVNYTAPLFDIQGNTRPNPVGSNPDQGAYENVLGEMLAVQTNSQDDLPSTYALHQNTPNPFNPVTAISYELQASSFTNLAVYDISGRKVAELVNGWRDAGKHKILFDGSDFSSGIYIYQIKAGEFEATGKMVLIK